MRQEFFRKTLRPWLAGLGVALLGMLVSVMLARKQLESLDQVEAARFAQATNSLTEALMRRIDAYTEIAFGLRGLFIVYPELSRRAFVDAVSHLDINTRHSGVKNIAFTRYVRAYEKQRFENQVRADHSVEPLGYPEFAIHPAGEREEYFVADYLWPVSGNQGIHGLDISAQPANLASMHYSLRSGKPVASAPFDLLQEATHRAGFVIRVPVFRNPHISGSTENQASNFVGSVAVTLRVFDLFKQLEREGRLQGLLIDMFDEGSSIVKTPHSANSAIFSTLASRKNAVQTSRRELDVYGRKWRLEFAPAAPFLSESEHRAPLLIGLAGGVISLLLGVSVMLALRDRMHALERAAAAGEALKSSESRWQFALEGSGDGLWDWNVPENTVFFSTRWKEMLGFADEEISNDFNEWRKRVHPDDYQQAIGDIQAHIAETTRYYDNEHRLLCKDGNWKWISSRGMVISRDAVGKPLRMIGTHSDITERKLAAQALQISLKDKEALLKEVHHRVKNNLQVISSLLRLESRRSVQADTKAVLGDMQGRIRSMALLHESLYRSGTFASIDLGDYLGKLAGQAFRAQSIHHQGVQLKLNLASVQVGMDQAIPCGLLLNELISNCLKHGFPDQSEGEVRIELQPAQDQQRWCLRVSDTGAGLPPDFEQRRKASLGLQLACDLAKQLGGTLEMGPNSERGMASHLTFELIEPAPLVMPA